MRSKHRWFIAAGAAALAAAAFAAETITYRYDSRGRLVKVERSGTVNTRRQLISLAQVDSALVPALDMRWVELKR